MIAVVEVNGAKDDIAGDDRVGSGDNGADNTGYNDATERHCDLREQCLAKGRLPIEREQIDLAMIGRRT